MKTTTKVLFAMLIFAIAVLSYKVNCMDSEIDRLDRINRTQNEVINNLLDRQEFLFKGLV